MASTTRPLALAVLACACVLVAARFAHADALADRLTALEARAAELRRQRTELARRVDAARRAMSASEQAIATARARADHEPTAEAQAALESALARGREAAVMLHLLDGQAKRLGDVDTTVARERVALTDALIERAQGALDRDAASLDGAALRARLADLAELRRRRDGIAGTLPAVSSHRGADLAAMVAAPGDSPDALAEKADLVDAFARGWRQERDEAQRRLAQSQQELDLVRRLLALMEARRRGRVGASDPFAADVEAFTLRERERQLVADVAATERRVRELGTWIDDAQRRRAVLMQTIAGGTKP